MRLLDTQPLGDLTGTHCFFSSVLLMELRDKREKEREKGESERERGSVRQRSTREKTEGERG